MASKNRVGNTHPQNACAHISKVWKIGLVGKTDLKLEEFLDVRGYCENML